MNLAALKSQDKSSTERLFSFYLLLTEEHCNKKLIQYMFHK